MRKVSESERFSKVVRARIPVELKAKLVRLAKRDCKKESEVVRQAVVDYLNSISETPETPIKKQRDNPRSN